MTKAQQREIAEVIRLWISAMDMPERSVKSASCTPEGKAQRRTTPMPYSGIVLRPSLDTPMRSAASLSCRSMALAHIRTTRRLRGGTQQPEGRLKGDASARRIRFGVVGADARCGVADLAHKYQKYLISRMYWIIHTVGIGDGTFKNRGLAAAEARRLS